VDPHQGTTFKNMFCSQLKLALGFLTCSKYLMFLGRLGGVPEGSLTAREACPRLPGGFLEGSWKFLEGPRKFLEASWKILEVRGRFLVTWLVGPLASWLAGTGCLARPRRFPEGSWRFPEMLLTSSLLVVCC
jgi:hypothetical protein